MSRINTNVQSMIAQRVLGQNNQGLGVALERLSTGLKINRGKDDPAGLIASENLRSEQKSLNQAIANADRADQVMNIAEGGLQEVSNLLTELQGLVTASASKSGISTEEKRANQLQIDSILQTIDRIAGATNFQGAKLLNGNLDYDVRGQSNAQVNDVRVNAAKYTGSSLDVNAVVTQSAQQGALLMSFGAASLTLNNNSASRFTIEVAGSEGSREFSFASGVSVSSIISAINTFTDVTGVSAVASGTTGIKLQSEEYGNAEFVSVRVVDDGGTTTGAGVYGYVDTNFRSASAGTATTWANAEGRTIRDAGQDIAATINGILATGKGRNARVATDFLDVEVTFTTGTSGSAWNRGAVQGLGGSGTPTFTINGGGGSFQLSSKVDIGGQVAIGIQNVAARNLGNTTTGFLSSLASGQANNVVDNDNLSDAQGIVDEAIKQVSGLRGRLGAFQKNVVGATIRSLGISLENTAAAQSVIRDSDFAQESANLTRSQILVSAATNILSLANSQPQTALQLLG